MRKQSTNLRIATTMLSLGSLCALVGCNSSNQSTTPVIPEGPVNVGYRNANSNPYLSTIDSLVSTDALGRSFGESDVSSSDRRVGMFYFVWHGEHCDGGIFDVEKLKKDNPTALWAYDDPASPHMLFHYFSEPLYGYYCSDDPWVFMRHVELLTMMGIDYISLDLTNFGLYEKNCSALFETLLKMQSQGWRVPLVTSFLNGTSVEAQHLDRITKFYNIYYTDPRYDSLWLRDTLTGKPLIAISMDTYTSGFDYYTDLPSYIKDAIKFRNGIWPYSRAESEFDDASWMDWCYPQRVYHNSDGNYLSVSVAQHPDGAFGYSVNPATKATHVDSNRGRGWNYETERNDASNWEYGANLESQWNNAINARDNIDEVFVTGWNEWIAYKLHGSDLNNFNDDVKDAVTFCDTADLEYSRDLEMTRGGYGDNFYLQNTRLTRQYKFYDEVRYFGAYSSYGLGDVDWEHARVYMDFEGDAMPRYFERADHGDVYINNTNRNDIVSTKVANDDNYLYIRVTTKDNIIIDSSSDNNMNILLSVQGNEGPKWNGYQYVLNRGELSRGRGETFLEKVNEEGKFEFDAVGAAETYVNGKTLSVAVPLKALGVQNPSEFTIDFKVADGISDPSDIDNYYIDGDSAPIGRLSYRYNSKHN